MGVEHLGLGAILGPSSLPIAVAQPDRRHRRHANRTILCWNGMVQTSIQHLVQTKNIAHLKLLFNQIPIFTALLYSKDGSMLWYGMQVRYGRILS